MAGGRFRFRISWVIPSFKSCRSKEDAAAEGGGGSPVFRASPANPGAPDDDDVGAALNQRSAWDGRVNFVVPSSSGRRRRGGVGPDGARPDSRVNSGAGDGNPPAYLWRKEEKWHVVARVGPSSSSSSSSPRRKIDSDDGKHDLFPPLPIRRPSWSAAAAAGKKKKKKKKNRRSPKTTGKSRLRVSVSSADNSQSFSSEDEFWEDYDYEEETEMLMSSSRSLSTEYSSSSDRRQKEAAISRTLRAFAASTEEYSCSPPATREGSSSASAARIRRLLTTPLDGKMKESLAVVKRSRDPYADFRRSMTEMVAEHRMYEDRDLEQLLHSFLLLNSPRHHAAIVRAFSDVWSAMFRSSVHGGGGNPAA